MPTVTFNIQDLPRWFMDDAVFQKNFIGGIDQDLESILGIAYKPAFVVYDEDNDLLTYSVEVPTEMTGEFLKFVPLIGGKII